MQLDWRFFTVVPVGCIERLINVHWNSLLLNPPPLLNTHQIGLGYYKSHQFSNCWVACLLVLFCILIILTRFVTGSTHVRAINTNILKFTFIFSWSNQINYYFIQQDHHYIPRRKMSILLLELFILFTVNITFIIFVKRGQICTLKSAADCVM